MPAGLAEPFQPLACTNDDGGRNSWPDLQTFRPLGTLEVVLPQGTRREVVSSEMDRAAVF